MLDIENNTKIYTNNCIKDLPFAFLVRPTDPGNGYVRVVMTEINEEEEKKLDNNKSLSLERGGLFFYVEPSYVLAYGEFDLSPNSDDIDKFYRANWLNRYVFKHYIPSEYDYNTHTYTSTDRRGKYFDTTNLKIFLPYLYACMNKPKRIIIFKEYMDIIAIRRAKQRIEKQKEYHKNNKDYLKSKRLQRNANKKANKLSKLTFNVHR